MALRIPTMVPNKGTNAPVVGSSVSRYGARKVTAVGAVLHMVAMITTVFANSIPSLFITFGLLNGVGLLLMYIGGISIVPQYFRKRFALAIGLSGAGAGAGAMVFPLLMEFLIRTYGLHGTFFILAGCSANILVCAAIFKPPDRPISMHNAVDKGHPSEDINTEAESRSVLDDGYQDKMTSTDSREYKDETRGKCIKIIRMWGLHFLCKYPTLVSFFFCVFLYGVQNLIYTVWIVVHAVAIGIAPIDAAVLLTYFGICAIISRLLYGWIIDLKILSPLSMLAMMMFINIIFIVTFTFVTNYAIMAVCCAGLGFCQGAIIPLNSVVVRSIVELEDFPGSFGLMLSGFTMGSVILPIAGNSIAFLII
ncbi:monocarboxylate transporter 12-like [Glandiceps talaboti]